MKSITIALMVVASVTTICYAAEPAETKVRFPGFSWDRVPLNLHFAKRRADLTNAEIDFIANQSDFVCLEKGHGGSVYGSTENGIAETARRILAKNPQAKVLFYFNAFINWPGYQAHETYQDAWTLRDANGKIVTHSSGTPRPDPSNAEFRKWWSDVVAKANETAPLGGVFIDAIPQAISPQLARAVGEAKSKEIVEGLREMISVTKQKLGPEKIVLVNGLRGTSYREILDWDGIDGVMIEHFGEFRSTSPESMKADLDSIEIAATKGKFVVLKGWPGFNWLDRDIMKRPPTELLRLAREKISFPLACYLVAAQRGTHFCYSWGYTSEHGMLEPYPEFNRKLGPPKGKATWDGMAAKREFEHAEVSINLSQRTCNIAWK